MIYGATGRLRHDFRRLSVLHRPAMTRRLDCDQPYAKASADCPAWITGDHRMTEKRHLWRFIVELSMIT